MTVVVQKNTFRLNFPFFFSNNGRLGLWGSVIKVVVFTLSQWYKHAALLHCAANKVVRHTIQNCLKLPLI